MLDSMRTTANSIFMKALMLLLVVSFAVWGVGDILRSSNNGHLVKVGDETITYPAYARAVRNTQAMMEAMGLKNVDPNMIEDQALRGLVEEKLVYLRLKDAGLEVDQPLLARELRGMQQFHDVRGAFDPATFKATLAARNMSEAAFLEEMKADLRSQIFTATIAANDLQTPPSLARLYATSMAEKRDAILVNIPAANVAFNAPDEAALKAYYEGNKDVLYLAPEKRTLEYVTFSSKDLESMVARQITDEALKERYETEAPEGSFEDNKIALAEALKAELIETAASDITIQVEDALAAGESMGAAIAKAGLKAQSRQLKDVTAQTAPADALAAEVAAQGFSMEEGETSSVMTTQNGTYYMVSVRSITPSAPLPYEQVAAKVKERATASARSKAVRERASKIQAALEADDWQAQLKELGATGRSVTGIRRGEAGPTSGMPPLLVEAVFEHEVGGIAGPMTQPNGDALVAKVTAITLPQTTPAPDAKMVDALDAEWPRDVLAALYRDLTGRYPVRVNQPMLERIRAGNDGA